MYCIDPFNPSSRPSKAALSCFLYTIYYVINNLIPPHNVDMWSKHFNYFVSRLCFHGTRIIRIRDNVTINNKLDCLLIMVIVCIYRCCRGNLKNYMLYSRMCLSMRACVCARVYACMRACMSILCHRMWVADISFGHVDLGETYLLI